MPVSDDIPTEGADEEAEQAIEAAIGRTPLPFEGLVAPEPLATTPPTGARWLAFVLILISGLLGGLIGYGTADVMGGSTLIVGLSGILGALIGAIGVGIVAGLTLRAMNEWHAVKHPEADETPPRIRRANPRTKG